MPKAKQSEQGAIIAWFSMKPLDECEGLLAIVQELMRRRRKDGKTPASKKKVALAKPESGGSMTRTFPPDSAAKANDPAAAK